MRKINNPTKENWSEILKRPTQSFSDIEETVKDIFKEVKQKGNVAIEKYTCFFDGVQFTNMLVSETEIQETIKSVTPELKLAIEVAKNNIEKFHTAQKTEKIEFETTVGVKCWQEKRPIQKVGLYIPGGSAPLFSTVLMLAIPAKIAGCEEIVLCSPPNKEGKINPVILYAASLCGVTKIFKVGGIQAIAGMTFGSETIPQVYKIFGPGNQYVTVAKQVATNYGIAIDMPAGPSELLVLVDETCNPKYVASDLLSQAEHGADSQVVLVTTDESVIEPIQKEIEKQLKQLPRKNIAEKAIANSKILFLDSKEKAIEIVNEYAPEHLIIVSNDEEFYLSNLQNAGSVFLGNYTPESAGDYASGTNHTLPTNGYAKNYSGVNLDSFMKAMTFQKITSEGLQNIGKTIEIMADAEGLLAHKNAITLRLIDLKK